MKKGKTAAGICQKMKRVETAAGIRQKMKKVETAAGIHQKKTTNVPTNANKYKKKQKIALKIAFLTDACGRFHFFQKSSKSRFDRLILITSGVLR